ncbi:hypothetical protein DVH24_030899 [Malus domestica]|uniref:Uncharacterized protein n=1 Tax=Malus domestica TaxID=3750 RepID=A0A498HAT9_MALDO|nr:hypothetical protein DVH24_030899 [Malus domestica]
MKAGAFFIVEKTCLTSLSFEFLDYPVERHGAELLNLIETSRGGLDPEEIHRIKLQQRGAEVVISLALLDCNSRMLGSRKS